MGIRASTRFVSMTLGAAPRCVVALICALALMTITFAHSVHHFGGPVAAVATQADVGTSDDYPDTSKKASIAIEQCHACSMIAMSALAPSLNPIRIAAEVPLRRFDVSRPHAPVAETPPPISTI